MSMNYTKSKDSSDLKFIVVLLAILFAVTRVAFGQTVSTPYATSTVASNKSNHNQISISNAATLILSQNISRRSLIIRNQGAVDMYIGSSSVSVANGMLLKASEVIVLDRSYAAWYGIVSAGTTTAGYLEE